MSSNEQVSALGCSLPSEAILPGYHARETQCLICWETVTLRRMWGQKKTQNETLNFVHLQFV